MAEKRGDDELTLSAEKVIAEFERLTRDAAAVQRETLRRILAGNAAAEYLRGLGLAGRTDPDSFQACVPLTTHADLEPYIARIADEGDTASHVLTDTPVTSISLRLVSSLVITNVNTLQRTSSAPPSIPFAMTMMPCVHVMQLRHDAGEAQVPALQAIQADDACVPDFLRFQEQVRYQIVYNFTDLLGHC
jgi:hypothetical protein